MINFDETKPSVLEGLGVSEIRFDILKAEYFKEGSKLMDVIKTILDSDLTLEEKFALIYDCGSVRGQQFALKEIQRQADEAQRLMMSQIQGTTIQ